MNLLGFTLPREPGTREFPQGGSIVRRTFLAHLPQRFLPWGQSALVSLRDLPANTPDYGANCAHLWGLVEIHAIHRVAWNGSLQPRVKLGVDGAC